MTNEERSFGKMALLAAALNQLQDESMDELKHAAFEVLLLHPGCDLRRWYAILCEQYNAELTDAFGRSPAATNNEICKLWETPYKDTASGLEYTFEIWAQCFCNEAAVQMYHDMASKNVTDKRNVSAKEN